MLYMCGETRLSRPTSKTTGADEAGTSSESTVVFGNRLGQGTKRGVIMDAEASERTASE